MKILFWLCRNPRRSVFIILALVCLLISNRQLLNAQTIRPLLGIGGGGTCVEVCPAGSICATYKTWDTHSDINIRAFNPQSIQDDLTGITNHLRAAAPTLVTAMENTCNGFSGLLYWSPTTNEFKTFCVTNSSGGFQFSVDLNRSTKSSRGSGEDDHSTKSSAESDDGDHSRRAHVESHVALDKTREVTLDDGYGSAKCSTDSNPAHHAFGRGDVWATVHSNADFAPYVNFQGSGDFMRWNVGADTATGLRVNPANGKVYFGNFGYGSSARPEPAEIIELDPATNSVRKWQTGNRPYQLFFDGTFVWATAVASETLPFDQILRLDPSAKGGTNLTRWNLPSNGSFQSSVVSGTNPNYVTTDQEGKVWFTETAVSKVGRLDPTSNTITEYINGSVLEPQNISSSGSHATLQAFFTEGMGNTVSVLTNSVATAPGGSAGVPIPVTPASSHVNPSTSHATPVAFTPNALTTTITPAVCQIVGVASGGIVRFPSPFTNSQPAGMTDVGMPQSVFGTLHGSSHVFELSSPAIIAQPPSASVCSEKDAEGDDDSTHHAEGDDDSTHDGGKGHSRMDHKVCGESETKTDGSAHHEDHHS